MRFVDLFCGCGGASLGLLKAGLVWHASADFDPDAVASYELLTGFKPRLEDLCKIPLKNILGKFRGLVWMSPPCQSFSVMQADADDCRAELLCKVFNQVAFEYPDSWIVLENVPNLVNFDIFDEVALSAFKSRRVYFDKERAREYVLNAIDFGVPQSRNRLFWIVPPKDTPVPPPPRGKVARAPTFRAAIGDFADPDPENWPLSQNERRVLEAQNKPKGFSPNNRWEDVPPTVLASRRVFLNSGKFNHPEYPRRLTVGECMAIQGLPAMRLVGDMASRYRQVGNAVPPALSEAIGRTVLAAV